jgi:hypothetical protein
MLLSGQPGISSDLQGEHATVYLAKSNDKRRSASMTDRHFSRTGLGIFAFVVALLALLVSIDGGSGFISRAWQLAMVLLVVVATLAIYRRIWNTRGDFDDVRRIEGQSLYGVLPRKLRKWLFP